MHPMLKVVLHGASCGLVIGTMLLIGGRSWQPRTAQAQEAVAEPPIPEVVRAREFVLVDEKGTVRSKFALMNGCPEQAFMDKQGRVRLILGLTQEEEPALSLLDEHQVTRHALILRADESGGYTIYDSKSKAMLSLGQFADRMDGLVIGNADGTNINLFRDRKGTDAGLMLIDKQKDNYCGLTFENKLPELRVSSADTGSATLACTQDKNLVFEMYDKNEVLRSLMGIYKNQMPLWLLFDADKKCHFNIGLDEGTIPQVLVFGEDTDGYDLISTLDELQGNINRLRQDVKQLQSNPTVRYFESSPFTRRSQAPSVFPPVTLDVIVESRIAGEFRGWTGDTVFKLANGQIWQQSEIGIVSHYTYNPEVTIYKDGLHYKMLVDGLNRAIQVKRLK